MRLPSVNLLGALVAFGLILHGRLPAQSRAEDESLISGVSGARTELLAAEAAPGTASAREITVTLQAGTPLRVAVEEKTPIRPGQPIRARLVHPLYVFDREVVPAGTTVLGRVSQVRGTSGKDRAKTYLRGRLRIVKEALVEFDALVLADGTRIPVTTAVTPGASAVIRLTAGGSGAESEHHKDTSGAMASAKTKVKSAVANNEIVRAFHSGGSDGKSSHKKVAAAQLKQAARGKWRGLQEAFLPYWPFGEQNLHPGANFTAVLQEPLPFGPAALQMDELARLGSPPAPGSIVQARLLETVTSETAQVGSIVRAEITRPLLSAEGDLILPEGAQLEGEVTQVRPARRFGRDGKLRFRFTRIEMPSGLTQFVNGALAAAEVDSRSRMKLDAEGGARVSPSKVRFIVPAISVAVAMTGVPDNEDGVPTGPTVQGAAPGWSGFGLLGSAAALSTPAAAAPLGIWGAANSIYFNLIRKANELELPANTLLEIRFDRASERAESPPPQCSDDSEPATAESEQPLTLRTRIR